MTNSLKQIIKSAFNEVIEAKEFNLAAIEKYFSPKYVQCVDGKTLRYNEFVAHLKKQKEAISGARVQFLNMAQDGTTVFTNHEVSAVRNDQKVKFKVIAMFTIENGKIVACDELTRMIEGHEKDRDLGSRC